MYVIVMALCVLSMRSKKRMKRGKVERNSDKRENKERRTVIFVNCMYR